MFCSNCGKKIGNEIKFCPHCGKAAVVEELQQNNVNTTDSVEVSNDKEIVRNEEKVTKKKRKSLKDIRISKPMKIIIIGILIIFAMFLWGNVINGAELGGYLKYGTEKDADLMHKAYEVENEALFLCEDGKICAIALNADSNPRYNKVRVCGILLGDDKGEVEKILGNKFEESEATEVFVLYKEIKTGYQLLIEYSENNSVEGVYYYKNKDGAEAVFSGIYKKMEEESIIEEPLINFNCAWNKNSTVDDDMYAVAEFTEDGKMVCIESFDATSGRGIAMFEGTYVGKDDFRDIYENEEYGYITLCTSMNGIYIEGFPKDEQMEIYHFIGITGEYNEEVTAVNSNQIQYEGTAGIVQDYMDANLDFLFEVYYVRSLPTTGEIMGPNLERCTTEYFTSYQEYVDWVHDIYVDEQADYFINQAKYFSYNGVLCLNTAYDSGFEEVASPWNTYTITILNESNDKIDFEVSTMSHVGSVISRYGTLVNENGYWKLTGPVW